MNGLNDKASSLSLGGGDDGSEGSKKESKQPAKKLNVNAVAFVPNFGAPAASAPAPVPASTSASSSPQPVRKVAKPAQAPAPVAASAGSQSSSNIDKGAASNEPELSAEMMEDVETFYSEENVNGADGAVADNESTKDTLNVVFIGHVDAGKSTLGGHILYLTGMVDKRTLEKFEKEAKEMNRESWFYSWALDTNMEERSKGITVFCGKAYFETENRKIVIIDAPGHRSYVPNMISGAAQADVGILVISARKGEFEAGFDRGGQTREHAMLAKTNGLDKLVVVINKMDEPTVKYSKERYDEIVTAISKFLREVGFNVKEDVSFMPISGFTGANIKERVSKADCPWYDGPSLLEFLDTVPCKEREYSAPLMIPVAERVKDMGVSISGKIESGRLAKNQPLIIMPNKTSTEVVNIYVDDKEVKSAKAGENVQVKLKGVDEGDVSPGFLICDVNMPVKVTNHFIGQIFILNAKNIICPGFTSVLHIHTCTEEITITELLHLIDKKTGKRVAKKPMFVKQGQRINCRIECSGSICVETFNDFKQLGRFTLRNEGETIAIGKVIKVLEPKITTNMSIEPTKGSEE